MKSLNEFFTQRIKRGLVRRLNNLKITSVAREVARREPKPDGAPVVFFKASSGIDDLSWNSGFHLLASWALRLKGIPCRVFCLQFRHEQVCAGDESGRSASSDAVQVVCVSVQNSLYRR
jgi:hypothetical protein